MVIMGLWSEPFLINLWNSKELAVCKRIISPVAEEIIVALINLPRSNCETLRLLTNIHANITFLQVTMMFPSCFFMVLSSSPDENFCQQAASKLQTLANKLFPAENCCRQAVSCWKLLPTSCFQLSHSCFRAEFSHPIAANKLNIVVET